MSSDLSRQYHSITIGEKNTWDDWHLIPASRPEFSTPNPKSKFIGIPGMEGGGLDISEIQSGKPVFENRNGSLEFVVMNGYGDWEARYTAIREYLHGKKLRAVLDDDPNFYYEGRFKLDPWKSDKNYSIITINYDVDPYKKDLYGSMDDWLWDPFDFKYGVINHTVNMTVNGTMSTTIYARDADEAPTILASSNMSVKVNGVTFAVRQGTHRYPLMRLKEGINTFVFTGNGTVSIDYRGGML